MMRTCLTGLGMTALAGVLALAPATGTAQDKTGWPSSIKVGTASQGGTYFIYGAGWAGLATSSGRGGRGRD